MEIWNILLLIEYLDRTVLAQFFYMHNLYNFLQNMVYLNSRDGGKPNERN